MSCFGIWCFGTFVTKQVGLHRFPILCGHGTTLPKSHLDQTTTRRRTSADQKTVPRIFGTVFVLSTHFTWSDTEIGQAGQSLTPGLVHTMRRNTSGPSNTTRGPDHSNNGWDIAKIPQNGTVFDTAPGPTAISCTNHLERGRSD